jgi:hypothetical protein
MRDEGASKRANETNRRLNLAVSSENEGKAARQGQGGSTGGRVSYRLAWLLALLATLTFEIAAADGDRPAWTIALTVALQAAIVGALSLLAWRLDSSHGAAGKSRVIWILCLATIPFIIEILVRGAMNTMLPLELLLLACFRNGVLALAIFAHRSDCQRMCCSLSTFLTIFASAISTQLWLQGLVVVFAIVGVWWLMGTYWESLQDRLAATSERDLSRRWFVALPLLVLLMLVGLPVAGTQTHALSGFMPSSGGSDWYSETARSGVGDGDNLVAGTENIQSFAPIEDAPFLSSHEPSLYDLFDDTYNKPEKIRNQDRAIALTRELAAKQKDHHLAESKLAGKQFSTLRKQNEPERGKIGDRDSNALLYVKGRVPLHLKLEVFDQYDGINWFPEPLAENNPKLTMQTLNSRPWLRLPGARALNVYASPETHALKIIRLDTNRVPSPTELLGVHIDKLDREDFYTWAQPGIVRMDREKLPALTVMHVQSRVVDERLIARSFVHLSGGSPTYRQFGDDERSLRVRELAQEWTKDASLGWPQVQAIVERLNREYVHDRDTRPPSDCDHTVAHFLFESRRGPDYQFASAAVQLLRSLGYSARLVSGFYASPTRFEVRARHTPVLQEDVHFWVEVFAGSDNWLPIEPTPGYELLQPPPTLIEQIHAAALAALSLLLTNAVSIAFSLAVATWLFVQRRFVADLVATAMWRWLPVRDERGFVQQTLRLLDRRFERTGHARPRGTTATRWLARLAQRGGDSERQTLLEFSRLAEWASFAPQGTPSNCAHPRAACHQAVHVWSWKRIVQAMAPPSALPRQPRTHSSRLLILQQPAGLLGKIAE